MADCQVLAVVGEVGVPGPPDHPGHRVQTHPVEGGVRPTARPDQDGARGSPGGLEEGGLSQEGEEGGLAGAAVRPGQEDELGETASCSSVSHLHPPHQELSHLPLGLQLDLEGPDELGGGEERQVVAGLAGDEGDEELHLRLPDCPPDPAVRQGTGGEDADEGTGGLPGVHVSHHHAATSSSAELVIALLESFKVFNKGQVPGSVETLEIRGDNNVGEF